MAKHLAAERPLERIPGYLFCGQARERKHPFTAETTANIREALFTPACNSEVLRRREGEETRETNKGQKSWLAVGLTAS